MALAVNERSEEIKALSVDGLLGLVKSLPGYRRDYLYVEDLASALLRLLESDLIGPINVASGRAIELNTLTNGLAERVGRTDLLRPGALQAPAGEPAELVADVTRLATELGWSPAITHSQGLSRTLAWWRRQGNTAV